MRQDRRPYWVKKIYITFRTWYTNHFLRPACEGLGDYHTVMKPWYVHIGGPNIRIGRCATLVAEPDSWVRIGVWGAEPGKGSITIGDFVMISPGVRISAAQSITIGDAVMMANGAYVTDSDWHGIYDRVRRDDLRSPVVIGDNVWLGDNSTVLKGVTIGENSVVAARAVVTRDVPANVVVAGNPARVVKQLDTDKGFVTRADYFADPEGLRRYYDTIERQVLTSNGFFNWLRILVKPGMQD
jgi:acetyltransferase-like isoleucine patch superfamily enzyme